MDRPFWESTSLRELTSEQWESLCDGCGKCCLHKLRDEDTEVVYFTRVACEMLDVESCRCSDYASRFARMEDCIQLTPDELLRCDWLPATCAYRLLAEGKPLPEWHPLLTGDPESVHRAGQSVRGRVIAYHKKLDLEDHLVDWAG
ncbi:MAG: YcgN family cysteine cluster protein [Chromatiales bacterium]|jgi:uncharacterized cysteine cluster protein YcgN (CxxCxxCC family)|nr:YcgN family cysteine cluster protein [Chromatiales bacterium]MDX9768300.1 YcgN family cysteine cluster protein [Ectothiorhodospiraceae bacterium]